MKGSLTALFCTVSAAAGLFAQTIVLRHATVIDGGGGAPQDEASIVIVKGQIREIGPSASVKIPREAQEVDLRGKTIIPGVINTHGHVGMVKGLSQGKEYYTRENVLHDLQTYARYGVTTSTSLGADLDLILEIREQRRGRINGARVYTALQGFTARGGVSGMRGVALEAATASQARAWVDDAAKRGAGMIKMWVDDAHDSAPKLTPLLYGAIIEQAHKRGLKVFAHVYELSDAKGLVDAGVDVLAHSVRDAEVDDALIQAMKRRNVSLIPTLTREQSTFCYAEPPAWMEDPFFTRNFDAELISAVKAQLGPRQAQSAGRETSLADYQMASRNLKKLAGAGVRIALGTDSGPPARFHGFFEHWEMELMAHAGLTPMQIIESFSKNAAETLGIEKDFGTLTKGHAADLIVLDANPLDDIRNTRRIHAVYIGGRPVE